MTLSKEDIKKIVESSFLKADHKFESPPVCLEISGQYGIQTFATLGNFSTILAAPKVGKTTATGIIVGALLTGRQLSNFIPSLPDNKQVVVWIDTEQGKPECIKTIQSICNHSTGNKTSHPDNFIFSSLRKHGKDVRLMAIEYLIYNTPNIGFLIIDGIRDLVSSINDEREATYIADNLLRWTQELNIHILTILHQNKGDSNARGHLGTELMNKAETVAMLSRDEINGKRITLIEPKFARHKEFEPFAFTIDENGMVFDSEVKTGYDNKNPTVEQLTHYQLEMIAKQCFSSIKFLPYGKLWLQIKTAMSAIELNYGDNKCKQVLAKLQSSGYIVMDEQVKHYYLNIPV